MLIFVVGAARSGTTMMCRVLGSHPEVLGMNELHFFGELMSDVSNSPKSYGREQAVRLSATICARQRKGLWGGEAEDVDFAVSNSIFPDNRDNYNGFEIFEKTVVELARQSGKRFPCEQTPRNIYYASSLLRHLPGVKFVHMIRDPRGVIASQKSRWRRKKLGASAIPWTEMLRVWANFHPFTMCQLWERAVGGAQHLNDSDHYLAVRFEDVVTRPEEAIRKICRFLNIEFHKNMLNVPMIGSSRRGDSQSSGFSTDALDGWQQVLSKCEIALIESILGERMQSLGYQPSGNRCALKWVGPLVKYPFHLAAMAAANPKRLIIQLRAVIGSRS